MEQSGTMKPVSPGGSAAKDANKINFEVHGTRTGVRTDLTELPKPGRFESLEQRFDGARSPDPADVAAGETTVDVEEERKSGESTRRPRPRANALKDPPLTLPGASKNKHIGPIKESAAYARARLLNCSISPSDMSTVSTAPPTPQFPSISHQETPVVTQGNPAESATATNLEESQSINSKSQDADSSDVDDELVPPPPAPDDVPEAPSQEHGDDAFPLPDDDMDDVGQGGDTLEMTDHRQEDSFTNAHVDVGLPSEIDAEENGSDDLNAEPSGIEATEVIDTPKDKDERPSAKGTDTELKSALKTPKEDHTDFGGGVDDDKEGEGFNMVHDPETPESVREERIQREEQEMAQNRKKKRGKKREPSLGDDNSESKTRVKPAKSKKNKKKVTINSPRGYPSGPRGYSVVPVDDLVETNETEGLRRSNRARTEPLEYWRNERFVYGANEEDREQGEEVMGNMPVVRSVLKACDTPYKKRKMPQTSHKNAKATNKKSRTGRSDEDDEETAFDARKLKKKYDFIEGENAMVWNDAADDAVDEKVISYGKSLERHELPLPATRKKSDGKVVGRAAQAFNVLNEQVSENYVGYIMGHLTLPPKGVKDYEPVGLCAQTFTVCLGQPGSLEVSIADPDTLENKSYDEAAQRFLLSPGDMFRIPQNNVYQLQNHSKSNDCLLTWTIIRPHSSG